MNLHDNAKALDEAIRAAAKELSLPVTYVEKDYWVSKALKDLATSAVKEDIVFKGGTSLSKAYDLIARFSEDIDVAVLTGGLSKNQASKKVRKASKAISGIFKEIESPDTAKNSHFRKVRFAYPRIDNSVVEGQITDSLLLEVNAFADPEPHQKMHITSYVADFFNKTGQVNDVTEYKLEPFEINVLCKSRTVCEKVMALVSASYGDDYIDNLRQKVRHIYDLHFLLKDDFTKDFVESSGFQGMLAKVVCCDRNAFSSTPWLDQPLAESRLFSGFNEVWPELETTYNGVFKAMVVDKNLPSGEMIKETFGVVLGRLKSYDANQA